MEGKKIALIAGGLVVALIAGFFAYRAMPQGEVTQMGSGNSNPDDAFFREMAKKCQGDFNKLTPADQKTLLAKCGNRNYASTFMTRYWAAEKK